MIGDIVYKSDILDGLFTQKDFEFLKDTNNRQEELEFKLENAVMNRNKIIEYIKGLENEDNSNIDDTKGMKFYIEKAEETFESTNNIIRNLNKLLDEFNEIEKEILELVVKKESNPDIDAYKNVESINNKIAKYIINQRLVEIENDKYNKIIEEFFKNNLEANLTEKDKDSKKRDTNKKNMEDMTREINLQDKLELIISEKQKRVYLPYTKSEIIDFLENYPEEYRTPKDVIEQEFITDISIYNKHPVLARFREAYSLSRNKEMKSAIDSFKFAIDIMFRSDINPTIIAAVKTIGQLTKYMDCLEKKQVEKFPYFTIRFEVNPI